MAARFFAIFDLCNDTVCECYTLTIRYPVSMVSMARVGVNVRIKGLGCHTALRVLVGCKCERQEKWICIACTVRRHKSNAPFALKSVYDVNFTNNNFADRCHM